MNVTIHGHLGRLSPTMCPVPDHEAWFLVWPEAQKHKADDSNSLGAGGGAPGNLFPARRQVSLALVRPRPTWTEQDSQKVWSRGPGDAGLGISLRSALGWLGVPAALKAFFLVRRGEEQSNYRAFRLQPALNSTRPGAFIRSTAQPPLQPAVQLPAPA